DGGVGLADRLERSAQAVKAAYSECPSYDEVVPALLSYGPWELSQHCHFKPSVPVKPMLAKPTTGVGEVLEKFKDQEFTCEYKYDGERAQVHIMEGGAKIMIFS
ncbi:DNA ligase, partial [Haematococcus lacustris]